MYACICCEYGKVYSLIWVDWNKKQFLLLNIIPFVLVGRSCCIFFSFFFMIVAWKYINLCLTKLQCYVYFLSLNHFNDRQNQITQLPTLPQQILNFPSKQTTETTSFLFKISSCLELKQYMVYHTCIHVILHHIANWNSALHFYRKIIKTSSLLKLHCMNCILWIISFSH